ncbi:MAG TPA: BlaI/MecI/CopY family transcriptional regulator [Gemmatimonas sp.]|uniref:BlaI/MecI/CopY family transcriptional regulator n=1 Tax=Gemmatimonas sp. TaxID=1962908 RepID=UPI002ED93C34
MVRNIQVPDLPPLSTLERDVMRIVWDAGEVTADDVRQQLTRPLKDATVRTVLRRLEEKGYVTHSVEGRTFLFRSVHPREAVAGGVLKQFAESFFGSSVSALLVGLVEAKALSSRDLQTAMRRIEAAREKEGRKEHRDERDES